MENLSIGHAEATSNQITKAAGKKKYSMDVSKSMHNDDTTVCRYILYVLHTHAFVQS